LSSIVTLSLLDALPIWVVPVRGQREYRHVVRAQRYLPAAGFSADTALGAYLRRRGVHCRGAGLCLADGGARPVAQARSTSTNGGDRKSTRLNSSHVKIS